VFDPNVLVSILIGKRVAALNVIFHGPAFRLVLDESLIAEFDEMARRTKFRKYFHEEVVGLVVEQLRVGGELVEAPKQIEKICRDPEDDHLLALCKTATADVLITGDEDLLVLGQYGRTSIVAPASFVKEHL